MLGILPFNLKFAKFKFTNVALRKKDGPFDF